MKTMDEYYQKLGELLDECTIVDLTLSPLSFEVSFVLKGDVLNQFYRLTFSEVKSLMWFTDGNADYEVYPCFTEINRGPIPITSSDTWLKQFSISFHTVIEIEELALLIGSGSIKLEAQDEAGNVGGTILDFTCETDDTQEGADGSEASATSRPGFWMRLKDALGFGKKAE